MKRARQFSDAGLTRDATREYRNAQRLYEECCAWQEMVLKVSRGEVA